MATSYKHETVLQPAFFIFISGLAPEGRFINLSSTRTEQVNIEAPQYLIHAVGSRIIHAGEEYHINKKSVVIDPL